MYRFHEHRLEHGDYIKIADNLFRFLLGEKPEDHPGPLSLREDEDDIVAEAVIEMQTRDSLYLHPDRILALLSPDARTARHLNALLEISNAILNIRGVEPLAQSLADSVAAVLPAERVALVLAEGDDFGTAYAAGKSGREEDFLFSRTITRRFLKEGVALLCDNVIQAGDSNGSRSLEASQVRCLLCVPLTAMGRKLGVIYADSREPRSLEQDHLQLAAAIASIGAAALGNALRVEWLERENRCLRSADLQHDMVGESAAMEKVFTLISRVAPSDCTVLIQGESGTGKELAALALHRNSPRAGKPFIDINCAGERTLRP